MVTTKTLNHPLPILPLAVCVLPERGHNQARSVSYPQYIFEILAHAGIFHTKLAEKELENRLGETRVLVTVGEAEFPATLKQKLTDWVNAGGAWLSWSVRAGESRRHRARSR